MLKNWQAKYPKSFAAHTHIVSTLEDKEQNILDKLLTQLAGKGVLNEEVVDYLLSTIPGHGLIFINRALDAGVDFKSIQSVLSTKLAIDGLSRTITLFDHSAFTYSKANLDLFALLTLVLANPLCQTIFDARLRCFSNYSMPSDPLKNTTEIANSIIQQVSKLDTQEKRVAAFFDFFTQYRPFPASQEYIVEIDIAEKAMFALTAYCQAMINAITNKQDYIKAKQLIQKIRSEGGNKELFDALKYEIASSIEDEDMCSSRTYQDHMDAIWEAWKAPQSTMNDFANELQNSKGYKEMMTASMQGHALLAPAAASNAPAQAQEPAQELAPHQ